MPRKRRSKPPWWRGPWKPEYAVWVDDFAASASDSPRPQPKKKPERKWSEMKARLEAGKIMRGDPNLRADLRRWLAEDDIDEARVAADLAAKLHKLQVGSGRKTAQERHADHMEQNVEPYREEYRKRLREAKQQNPTKSYRSLSCPIIVDMAKRDGKREKWMRDTISPTRIWKELRKQQCTTT